MPSDRSSNAQAKTTKAFKPPRPSKVAGSKAPNATASRQAQQGAPPDSDDDSAETAPAIPPQLLVKLIHAHFEDPNTKMSKAASGAVGKYMETFVREALARAAFERSEEAERLGGGGRDMFLEVSRAERSMDWSGKLESDV